MKKFLFFHFLAISFFLFSLEIQISRLLPAPELAASVLLILFRVKFYIYIFLESLTRNSETIASSFTFSHTL